MTYRSIPSAAGELRMSQSAVKRAILDGRIPAVEIQGVWRIPASYFEELETRAYGRLVRDDVLVPPRLSTQPRRGLRVYDEVDEDLSEEELLEDVFPEGADETAQRLDELRWSA